MNTGDIPAEKEESITPTRIPLKVSSSMKGMALVMMFVHHMYGFPSYYLEEYPGPTWMEPIGLKCGYCIPIFAFLSGWFYASSSQQGWIYSLKKAGQLFVSYWIPATILIGIALCCGWKPSAEQMLQEYIPTRGGHVMKFCWYVVFYVLCMGTLALYGQCSRLKNKPAILAAAAAILAISTAATYWASKQGWLFERCYQVLAIPFLGYYLAQSSTIAIAIRAIARRGRVCLATTGIGIIALAIAVNTALIKLGESTGIFTFSFAVSGTLLTLGLMLCLQAVEHCKACTLVAMTGQASMNLWFLHCIFMAPPTAPIFQPLITFIGIPGGAVASSLAILFPIALMLTPVQTKLIRLLHLSTGKRCAIQPPPSH